MFRIPFVSLGTALMEKKRLLGITLLLQHKIVFQLALPHQYYIDWKTELAIRSNSEMSEINRFKQLKI
jgi:hypothetical protein